jgi:P4 family phage/plasmid primase-like protien
VYINQRFLATMTSTYHNFDDFLRNHTCKERKYVTHTRIPDKKLGIYGGSYSIPDEELDLFYKLYSKHVLIDGNKEYLTEIQRKDGNGPILVDLDFRYDTSVTERKHSEDFADDIADFYVEKIKDLMHIPKDTKIPVWIMEKERAVITDKCTKDGIHIVFGVNANHTFQQVLRNEILKNIDTYTSYLELTNSKDDVVDPSISSGNTGWQLYGSMKPGNIPYKLTRYLQYSYNADEDEIDKEEIDFEYENKFDMLKMMSARSQNGVQLEMKDIAKEKCEEFEKNGGGKPSTRIKRKKLKKKITTSGYSFEWSDIQNHEQLEAITEKMLEELTEDDYGVRETHMFTMELPAKYYNPYENWIRVGWALHNTDERLFLTWMLFSSQSEKFDYDDIEGFYEKWVGFDEDGLTERSIMYWCKNDNYEGFTRIRDESVNHMIENSYKTRGESDYALVLYYLFKDRFRVGNEEKKEWYEYRNHRWENIGKGLNLRSKISGTLSNLYMKKADEAMIVSQAIDTAQDSDKQNHYRKLCAGYTEIGKMLKSTRQKDNIMKEALEIFYIRDPNFKDNLDTNMYLMGFKNGILDIKNKDFRPGSVDDYVSMSTNIDYIEYDPNNAAHRKISSDIDDFFEKVFPNKNVRKYIWQHMASMLVGENKTQSFNIYNGSGSNGKSIFVEILKIALGDYAIGSVPLSLITGNRPETGSTNTELLNLRNKRLAIMNEPKINTHLNEGAMKELTGGDEVQARGLYDKKITHFKPQFKLSVCTNTMFEVNSNDDGTWRRIKRIDFISKFVTDGRKPTKENPHIYKADTSLSSRLKSWTPILMGRLAQIAFEMQGDVDECEEVNQASNEYRTEQDCLELFVNEMIEKEEEGQETTTLKLQNIMREFKIWFQDNGTGKPPKQREIKKFLEKKYGAYKGGWNGYKFKAEYDDDCDEENSVGKFGDD